MPMIKINCGSGPIAIPDWLNYDASPSIFIGKYLPFFTNVTTFDDEVKYGSIMKGLPHKELSVDYVYFSHVLEHLPYLDAIKALKNIYSYLKNDGVLRIIVPNLESYIHRYVNDNKYNSDEFIKDIHMGYKNSNHSVMGKVIDSFRLSKHKWMWTENTLTGALKNSGFKEIVKSNYLSSKYKVFNEIDNENRFENSICFDAIK